MNPTPHEPLNLAGEELAILAEVLESAHARLLIEIRHTDHRAFRDVLRHRLELVESLIARCASKSAEAPLEATHASHG